MTPARRNLGLLVACQAVFMTSTAVVATVGVLAGHQEGEVAAGGRHGPLLYHGGPGQAVGSG